MGKSLTALLLLLVGGFLLIVGIPDLLVKVGDVQATAATLSATLGGVLLPAVFGVILVLIGVMATGLIVMRLRA